VTVGSFASDLAARVPGVLTVLVFRSLPFVFHACMARGLPLPRRLFVLATALVAAVAAFRLDRSVVELIAWAPAVAAYFALGAVLVHHVAVRLPRRVAKLGGPLVAGAALFVLLPAAVVHHRIAALCLVFGWEVMLSAHSYCVEVASSDERPTLADCAFFLLVTPTVVYPERGSALPDDAQPERGALRVVRGTATMLGRDIALLAVGAATFLGVSRSTDEWADGYGRFAGTQLVLLLGLYCAHSGLASIQIGWMRVIGWTVPERYRYPLLARDPQDFWRRWNIWLSCWARRYLYVPIAHSVGRRTRRRSGPLVGALAAFAGIGLLHDLALYAYRLEDHRRIAPSLRFTLVFVVIGLIVVAWAAIARAARRVTSRAPAWVRAASSVASYGVFVNAALGVASLAMPLLQTGKLPAYLERLLRHLAP
jgi:hypothetical protein